MNEVEQKILIEELRAMRVKLERIEAALASSQPASVHAAPIETPSIAVQAPRAVSTTTAAPTNDLGVARPVSMKPQSVAQSEGPAATPFDSSAGLGQPVVRSAIKQDRSTSSALGIIGMLCFVLAASFLIKLAIDSGWLTPLRQLGLAALFGITLILVGLRFRERDVAYLSLLPGTGIVILQMTAYAGKLFYNFYDGWTAGVLASLVSILSLVLFQRFKQDFYAVFAVVGSYASTLLLPSTKGTELNAMTFFLIWDVAYAVLSIMFKNRVMNLLAAHLALGVFSVQGLMLVDGHNTTALTMIAGFQLVQFLVFAVSVSVFSSKHQLPLKPMEIWAHLLLLVFFYGLEYSLVSRINHAAAPYLALAFAGIVYAIYNVTKRAMHESNLDSGPMVLSFCALVLFHAGYLELLPERVEPWLAVVLFASLPVLSKRLELKGKHMVIGGLILIVFIINYAKVVYLPTQGATMVEWLALNLLFFGCLFAFYGRSVFQAGKAIANEWLILLLLADAQALLGLSRLAEQLAIVVGIAPMTRFLVSAFWGLFALGMLIWSKTRLDRLLARSSLFIFAVAIGKVLLFDIGTAGALARIFSLLTLGVVCYVGGYLYRHIESWKTTS